MVAPHDTTLLDQFSISSTGDLLNDLDQFEHTLDEQQARRDRFECRKRRKEWQEEKKRRRRPNPDTMFVDTTKPQRDELGRFIVFHRSR